MSTIIILWCKFVCSISLANFLSAKLNFRADAMRAKDEGHLNAAQIKRRMTTRNKGRWFWEDYVIVWYALGLDVDVLRTCFALEVMGWIVAYCKLNALVLFKASPLFLAARIVKNLVASTVEFHKCMERVVQDYKYEGCLITRNFLSMLYLNNTCKVVLTNHLFCIVCGGEVARSTKDLARRAILGRE